MPEKTFTIDDLAALFDQIGPGPGRRTHAQLIAKLERDPQTAALLRKLDQMAIDAGTDRSQPGWRRETVEAHRTFDRLLALDRDQRALELEAGDGMTAEDYNRLLQIGNARQMRGEGEQARLAALEIELTACLQDFKTPGIREAQESLDLAIEQLVSAYARNVGPQLAPIRASQHLFARGCRELRGAPAPARQRAAG